MNPNRYAKALAAVAVTILTAILPFLSQHNTLTQAEWVNVVIVGAGAVIVYVAPNLPGSWSAYTKSILAAVVAGATVLASVIGSGGVQAVPSVEWVQVILAFVSALGVYAVPNVPAAAPVVAVVPVPEPTVPVEPAPAEQAPVVQVSAMPTEHPEATPGA